MEKHWGWGYIFINIAEKCLLFMQQSKLTKCPEEEQQQLK